MAGPQKPSFCTSVNLPKKTILPSRGACRDKHKESSKKKKMKKYIGEIVK